LLLGFLAPAAAAVTWWLSRRTHAYARAAEERRAAWPKRFAFARALHARREHDLKNPIHAIDGHAQLLEEGLRGRSLRAAGQHRAHRRSARALMALIEDLLELARAEVRSAHREARPAWSCATSSRGEAVEEHRAAAEAAGLTAGDADDKSETILVTDPARVTRCSATSCPTRSSTRRREDASRVVTECWRAAMGTMARGSPST
jgi:signal transduction histidine kinase